jgi:hypothetical protein
MGSQRRDGVRQENQRKDRGGNKKKVNLIIINLKHFIERPNLDKDIILEENVIHSINNLPEAVERNMIVDPDPE